MVAWLVYTLPFKSLGSPRQFRVFHEISHFYLSNEMQINIRYSQDIDKVGKIDFYFKY